MENTRQRASDLKPHSSPALPVHQSTSRSILGKIGEAIRYFFGQLPAAGWQYFAPTRAEQNQRSGIERENTFHSEPAQIGYTRRKLASRCNRHKRSSAPPLPCQYTPLEPRLVLNATFPTFIGGQLTLGNANKAAPYGMANTFKLNSLPSANKTIYLDFNGHHSVDNQWNHNYLFPAFNFTGGKSFSNSELIRIQKIYQNVAEDFLPFQINVTTEAPPTSDLVRSNGSDNRFGMRVVFTQTSTFGYGYGGISLKNSFRSRTDTPVFVFEKTDNIAAIVASHEVGHSLGLNHDGYYGQEYHPGKNGWGPLMGAPYSAQVTQWSNGDYAGSSTRQDDLNTITRSYNGVEFRQDDIGAGFDSAKAFDKKGADLFAHGLITQRNDIDAFRLSILHRTEVEFSVKPFQGRGNLDILARIIDQSGNLVATSNSHDRRDANFSLQLDPGDYLLTVDGSGKSGSYSDYGSLGFYSITGTVAEQPLKKVGFSGVAPNVTHKWKTITLPRAFSDPVVIAGPSSTNGSQPATVRIRNVTSRSFEIAMDEWDYLNQTHQPEMIGYLVIESGTHVLPDGTKIVAGNGYLNHVSRRIGFGQLLDERPNVFTQIVSHQGPSAVTTRVFNVTNGGFNLKMQEQDKSDGLHAFEQFSWLAIGETKTVVNQQAVESRTAPQQISHEDSKINFQSAFNKAPVLIAAIQTLNGPDSVIVRYKTLNQNKTTLFLQEDQSEDLEQEHIEETIGILAMDAGNVFAVDPASSSLQAGSVRIADLLETLAEDWNPLGTESADELVDTNELPSVTESGSSNSIRKEGNKSKLDQWKDQAFSKLKSSKDIITNPWL